MGGIKEVTASERDKFKDCMVTAFAADPSMRYFWPEPSRYLKSFRSFVDLYCGNAIANGTAWTIDDFAGVAGWLAPGEEQDKEALGDFVAKTCHPNRLEEVLDTFGGLERYHPKEPCWYLPLIGVDPGYWGRGLGGRLLAHTLERVDADSMPTYLESSNPLNVPLYRRWGFEVLGTLDLDGQPLVTPMLRPAQA